MFRRKKPASDMNRTAPRPSEPRVEASGPSVSRAQKHEGADEGATPNRLPPAPPARPEITPRRPVDIPGHPRRAAYATAAPAAVSGSGGSQAEGKKLIVGRDISLSGNIAACEKLIVEGTVEADVFDARIIEVAETGTFKGNAELDEADISGRFEGSLTVRNELRIRSTGIVEGTIRYARLVVEGGGRMVGSVEVLDGDAAKPEAEEAAGEEARESRPAEAPRPAPSLPAGTETEPGPAAD